MQMLTSLCAPVSTPGLPARAVSLSCVLLLSWGAVAYPLTTSGPSFLICGVGRWAWTILPSLQV